MKITGGGCHHAKNGIFVEEINEYAVSFF